jgi:hypothetical protein
MATYEFIRLIIIDIASIIAFMIPLIIGIVLAINGIKCLLRSEMLRIYNEHKERCQMNQYEFDNFIALYKAYKALKGNSFIDKIYKEIMTWKVET